MSNAAVPLVPTTPAGSDLRGVVAWAAIIGRTLNLALRGKINAATTVTLAPNATSTTLTDERIGLLSNLFLQATTASAATAVLTTPGVHVAAGAGSAVISHPSNAAADQIFSVLIIG